MGSDFGSSISIFRADGSPTRREDIDTVVLAAKRLQADGVGVSPYADLELVPGSCTDRERREGISLRLTSYFLDDPEDAANEDMLIANDETVAHQFANDLTNMLGNQYTIDWYSGPW